MVVEMGSDDDQDEEDDKRSCLQISTKYLIAAQHAHEPRRCRDRELGAASTGEAWNLRALMFRKNNPKNQID